MGLPIEPLTMLRQPFKQKIDAAFVALVVLIALTSQASAQERRYFFFNAYPYGSEALYNPASLIFNGGFDTFQIINDRDPTWHDVYWKSAATNIWRSATSPLYVISKFGWRRFLSQEVFPASLNIDNAQYAPNFMLHTIGGGMEYRKISEWYDYNGFPAPFVLGALTSLAFEYVNETVENGPNYYPNEDCIPDMLIFQPIGLLLFSYDGISEFFSSTVSLNDWSQPLAMTFSPFAIRNAGQNFVMKLALNQTRSTSLFFHFGNFAMLGLSFKTNAQDAVSFGAGLTSTGRKPLPAQNGVPSNSILVGPMVGVYYDRNNSLLASAIYSDAQNNRFRLNLYPGVLSNSVFSPGLFLMVGGNGSMVAGITARILPIGVGLYSPGR
jgi:hypothetical protein